MFDRRKAAVRGRLMARCVGRMLIIPVALGLFTFASATPSSAAETSSVSFNEQIAPIVFKNCSSCHRPGEGTPFPLLSYRDVKKRGSLIVDVVTRGYMPPWPPAKGWGHFRDDRRLSESDVALIEKWVDTGMAEGPADKLPPLPKFPAGGWTLGTPDLVVTLPEAFDVPADGKDIYRMFDLPLGLKEDQWVTAVEIRPTARSVVHHALYFLDSSGAARKLDADDPAPGFGRMGFPRTGTLGGWAVGATPRVLPMGLAYSLPKGSDLVVQMHFHPSGKAEREQTSFGLYFAKEPPRKRLLGTQMPMAFGIGTELRTRGIKPGEKDFTIHGEWHVPFDVDVVTIGGHAHYLCTKMNAIAELPDGKTLKLFAIDDWDFNWQGRYSYVEPVRLPKGTVVRTTLVYDNSADNPRNPSSPPVHVRWGEGSTDEMGSVGLAFVAVDEKDLANYRGPVVFGGGDLVGPNGAGANGIGAGRGRAGLLKGGAAAKGSVEQLQAIFDVLDNDKNRKLEGEEIPPRLRTFMDRLDLNGDGALGKDEVEAIRRRGLAPNGNGDGSAPRVRPGASNDGGDGQARAEPAAPSSTLAMTDLDGKRWQPLEPDARKGTKANVLVFVTRDCPISNQYTPEIGRLAHEYAGKGVAFLLVHVDPTTTASDAREHAHTYQLELPILLDADHRLVARTGAAVTPEAALIASDGKVVYCGRIDDRFGKLGRQRPEPSTHELRDAIDALLAGQPVATARVAAIGCPIADLAR